MLKIDFRSVPLERLIYHLFYLRCPDAFVISRELKEYYESTKSTEQWIPFIHYLPLEALFHAAHLVRCCHSLALVT